MCNPEAGVSNKTITLLAGGAGILGLLVGGAIHEWRQPEKGSASCDALEIQVLDTHQHIIQVATKFHLTGDAKIAGVEYRFDDSERNQLPVPADTPVTHTYPALPAEQHHRVQATIAYKLNGKEFGSVPQPQCQHDVVFKGQ